MVEKPKVKKILILDDDTLVRNTVVRMLESNGYSGPEFATYQADSRETGYAVFRSEREWYLIISDNKMPNQDDGLKFLRHVHADNEQWNKESGLYLVTGDPPQDLEEHLKKIGAKFIQKPLNSDKIQDHIVSHYPPV